MTWSRIRPWFNIKISSYQHRKSHCGDKTILRRGPDRFTWMIRVWRAALWWRHQMEAFSALLAICANNSPVPVNSPHKGQWRRALMFSLTFVWINNGWVNNGEGGDLRRNRTQYDVTVMFEIFMLVIAHRMSVVPQFCYGLGPIITLFSGNSVMLFFSLWLKWW